MNIALIREIVELVIKQHPKECIFHPDAVHNIVSNMPLYRSNDELIDYLASAVREQEIYCPHEGIDRRKS